MLIISSVIISEDFNIWYYTYIASTVSYIIIPSLTVVSL